MRSSDPKSVTTCYSSHKKLTETWQAHDQSASVEEELRHSGNVSGNHSPLLKTETSGQTWWHTPVTTTLRCKKKEKSGAQGHPQLHSKLKANLGVMANFSCQRDYIWN